MKSSNKSKSVLVHRQLLNGYGVLCQSSPDGIYERGVVDPGLPFKEYSKPFWLSEPSKISKLQSQWVEEPDVVIIGSGMTSVNLCLTLYSIRPELEIIVLEARELCSGATSRNGGHCKATSPGV